MALESSIFQKIYALQNAIKEIVTTKNEMIIKKHQSHDGNISAYEFFIKF